MQKREDQIKWHKEFIKKVAQNGWLTVNIAEGRRIADLKNKSPRTISFSPGYNKIFAEIIASTPQGSPRLE